MTERLLQPLRRSGAESVGSLSVCSDLRELNEAKVQGILSYLDEVDVSIPFPATGFLPYAAPATGTMLPALSVQPSAGAVRTPSRVEQFGAVSLGSLRGAQSPLLGDFLAQAAATVHSQAPNPHARPQGHADPTRVVDVQRAEGLGVPEFPREATALAPLDGNQVYVGLKDKLADLKLQAQMARDENQKLKSALAQQRAEHEAAVRSLKKQVDAEAEDKVDSLEKEVRKHLGCIKALVSDKEQLVGKVETLARENQRLKTTRDDDIKTVERKHAAALNELKGKWEVVEKQKREAWVAKESKKIKEGIIKAMEPDIARQLARHREEIARLEEQHREALQRRDEQLNARDRELSEVKTRAGRELEELLVREREAMRARAAEESERAARRQEDQRRLAVDQQEMLQKELTLVREELKVATRRVLDLQHEAGVAEHKTTERILHEAEKCRQEKEREVLELKSQLLAQRRDASFALEKEHADILRQREEEIVKRCELQRDQAIQKVISQLESDYVVESAKHRETEKAQREELGVLSRECERLKAENALLVEQRRNAMEALKAKDRENAILQEEIGRHRQDRHEVLEKAEREFAQRLRHLDSQWSERLAQAERLRVEDAAEISKQLREKDAECHRVRLDSEAAIRELEQQQHVELGAINDKVLVAISKRDQSIQQLSQRCVSLEAALQQRILELQRQCDLLNAA